MREGLAHAPCSADDDDEEEDGDDDHDDYDDEETLDSVSGVYRVMRGCAETSDDCTQASVSCESTNGGNANCSICQENLCNGRDGPGVTDEPTTSSDLPGVTTSGSADTTVDSPGLTSNSTDGANATTTLGGTTTQLVTTTERANGAKAAIAWVGFSGVMTSLLGSQVLRLRLCDTIPL